MNVSLTAELEECIEEKVASGFYQSASEVVREALRMFFNASGQSLIAEINKKIEDGYADLAAGRVYTPEQVRAYLAEKRKEWRKRK